LCAQDKEEALQALAAAAAAGASGSSSGSSNTTLLSDEEKQTLRDSGNQARQAENQQLAARVESSDAALRGMSQEDRGLWFEVSISVGCLGILTAQKALAQPCQCTQHLTTACIYSSACT
jgi:hypothetical protein